MHDADRRRRKLERDAHADSKAHSLRDGALDEANHCEEAQEKADEHAHAEVLRVPKRRGLPEHAGPGLRPRQRRGRAFGGQAPCPLGACRAHGEG